MGVPSRGRGHEPAIGNKIAVQALKNPVLGRVKVGDAPAGGPDDPPHAVHGAHRGKHRAMLARRHRPEEGGAEQDSFRLPRQYELAARDVGMLPQKNRILGASAAYEKRVNPVSPPIHRIDDVPRAASDRLDRRQITSRQIL